MITPHVPASGSTTSDGLIEFIMTTTKSHLQNCERMKFMRDGKTDDATGEYIARDYGIRDLVQADIVLIPMPIDPHGN